ncbi:MAG: hypothetical protein WAN10_13205, partial [Candidatus Acidiferrales bacterium]
MWGKVSYVNQNKSIGFCVNESGEKFIFSTAYRLVADAQMGDILQFTIVTPNPDYKPKPFFENGGKQQLK